MIYEQQVLDKLNKCESFSECASEKATRRLKVHRTSGYNYKDTSTLILKGEWLERWGFLIGTTVDVTCESIGHISIKVSE